MKKLLLILFILLFFGEAYAQYNLVPNPSFEVYDTCPNFAGQIRYAVPWTNPLVGTTPDYFNACDTVGTHQTNVPNNYSGFQYARTGNAYALVVTSAYPPNLAAWNSREYIQVELIDVLIAGVEYCIRWYVSICNKCNYVSNNMGMYFSPVEISYNCPGCPMPLPLTPQFENPLTNNLNDSMGWTEISGSYTALGGEKFIIIGNFHDTSSTVATYTGWTPGSSFWVSSYYIDDVLVTPCDSLTGINEIKEKKQFSIYPNPFNNYFEIKTDKEFIYSATITDIYGNTMFNEPLINSMNKIIELEKLANGIYFLKLVTSKSQYNFKLIKN
jgi:hypothetical protein